MSRTKRPRNTTIGRKVAHNTAIMSSSFKVTSRSPGRLMLSTLEVMDEETQPPGLTINWAKTKIQTTDVTVPPGTTVQVGGSNVEVVNTFTYLGSQLHSSGGSD